MEKDNTFFVCLKNFSGSVSDFYGPVLEDEIAEIQEEDFEGEETEVLSEKLFKNLYFEQYQEDFRENWVQYISTMLASIEIDVNIFEIEIIDEELDDSVDPFSEIIDIPFFGSISRHGNTLDVNINVDANPHLAAMLTLEINKYCDNILDVVIIQPIYVDTNNITHLNDEAYNKYELDKLKIINLN